METSNTRATGELAAHRDAVPSDDSVMALAEASGTGSRTDSNRDDCSVPVSGPNNIVHQRRRVNPESLALRLGPDLVRDLDALIAPGNTEMPSFAVRKELQERYNIDRRHIYDYFHSRGLRVVKEDKHGNPVIAKELPTILPNLRPLRQAPVKSARSYPSCPVATERKLFKPRGITKAKPGRPKKNLPKIVPSIGETHLESSESADTNDAAVSEHSPGAIPKLTYVSVNPLLPHSPPLSTMEDNDGCTFNSVANPLDESFSVKRAIGDIAYAYRHKSVFERMQELTEYPAKLALTDDRSSSWNETPPCSASDKGLLLPHAKPLTRDERQVIYRTMSDSLGPAHGIQECQGTYRKYMQARTKLYFEGLLSVPYQSQQPARMGALSDRKSSLGTSEFRHWLSETRFLKHDGTNGSPRLHFSYRNANMAKQLDVHGVTEKQYQQISITHWIPTLDELFPTLPNSDNTITDSPVVHMPEVTRVTAHARGVADDCSAGGRLLFLVTSNPGLPIIPITSCAATQLAGHAQLHGLSGFSGTQEVKTRVSLAEMDSHPQWPEHVPYVPHSGQHLSLSNAQRRGRKVSNNARLRIPSCSPRKLQIRDPDRIWTRPVTCRDARRRTPSAAGDI